MKKMFVFLIFTALCFTSSITSIGATTVTKVYTRHEKRYDEITSTYGDYVLRDYFYYETSEYVVDGTIRNFYDESCPTGWAYVPIPGGGFTPYMIEEPVGIIPFDVEQLVTNTDPRIVISLDTICEKIGSGYYTTQSSEDWEDTSNNLPLIWDNVPSNEKHDFYYESNLISPGIQATLIQGEVLLHFDDDSRQDLVYGIDRYTHYERNQYNIDFPHTFSDFETNYKTQNGCGSQPPFMTYFHRIAQWNGDTSNYENVKYLCDVPSEYQTMFPNGKSEVIYNVYGYKETNTLVEGTFNFDNRLIPHFNEDVFPYLVWGNSFNDTSTVLERLYWDQNSTNPIGDYYKYREATLYGQSTSIFFIKPDNTLLDESQWYIDNMYNIND